VRRHLCIVYQPLAPAGEHDVRRGWRGNLHCFCDLASIDVRHAEVRNHRRKYLVAPLRRAEDVDPRLAVIRGEDRVAVGF
jgi:hypothetical protein